ncbi:MAG: hypothetical protein JNL84_05525 [Candidatus Accumulibacter sp.]|nr:hypothetical protein [Accumulibacter sp.]
MLRIPPELIPPLPPAAVGKDADEPAAVGQVDATSASGDSLSGERWANAPTSYQTVARGKRQAVAAETAAAPVAADVSTGVATEVVPPAGASFPYERRQGDRRQQNRPVLLDTRVSRGRRQSSDDGGINIKV